MNFWHLSKVRSEGRSLPPLSMRSWNFRSAAKSSSLSSSCAETLLSQCFEGKTPHEKRVFYRFSKQKNIIWIYACRSPDVCFKSAHLPYTIGLSDHKKTNKYQSVQSLLLFKCFLLIPKGLHFTLGKLNKRIAPFTSQWLHENKGWENSDGLFWKNYLQSLMIKNVAVICFAAKKKYHRQPKTKHMICSIKFTHHQTTQKDHRHCHRTFCWASPCWASAKSVSSWDHASTNIQTTEYDTVTGKLMKPPERKTKSKSWKGPTACTTRWRRVSFLAFSVRCVAFRFLCPTSQNVPRKQVSLSFLASNYWAPNLCTSSAFRSS